MSSSAMGSQRSVPAPFLMKTYQLVDDERTDDVVSWNENGTTFVVWKTAEFAKDLLPNYFKHNNFSSFVRQLNTYGFRKTVPDKWEFANENFTQGQKQLLTKIRRRKTSISSTPGATGKLAVAGPSSSQVNSGDDIVSSSTSSPGTSTIDAQFADLTDQNEKLRGENQTLSVELAHAKKQCHDLVNLLTCHLKVSPENINKILTQRGDKGILGDDGGDGKCCNHNYDRDDNDNDDDDKGESLRLFGVTLKDKKRKKAPVDINNIVEDHAGEIKNVGESTKFIRFPWMKMVGC